VGELVVATLGTDQKDRFTHTLDAPASGPMYVSRGRFDAVGCDQSGPIGAVLGIDLSSPLPIAPTVVAQGFRNPMYLRCHPTTGACYANELSGDNWSGIGGREKLALVSAGANWGYPCCVGKGAPAAPGVAPSVCASVDDALVSIPLHDTPFGMDFDRGSFPAPYRGAAFIALHGAFPTWVGTRLVYVPVDAQGSPVGATVDFATGWGREATAKVAGRATDVAFAPDGRLFVVDDTSSAVLWIAPESLPLPDGW
jgi:glucose/arabinose dehydrogenase